MEFMKKIARIAENPSVSTPILFTCGNVMRPIPMTVWIAALFRHRDSRKTIGHIRPTEKPSAITIPSVALTAAHLILIIVNSLKTSFSVYPAVYISEENYILMIPPFNKAVTQA